MMKWAITIGLYLLAVCSVAFGEETPTENQDEMQDSSEGRQKSYELAPVVITAERLSALSEEERVGSYGQPRWSTRRLFGETRIYVIPEYEIEAEYWVVPEIPRHSEDHTKITTKYELEFGLPHRFQLDLYGVTHHEGNEGSVWCPDEADIELRYAFADWGVIPGNPTLYVEWKAIENAPDHFESKMLLGDKISPRWHWGLNVVYEGELGGDKENDYELNVAVCYTIIDEVLSAGLEQANAWADVKGDRGHYEDEHFLGPSFRVTPVQDMHIIFAPLFGLTSESPRAKAYLILGWEF